MVYDFESDAVNIKNNLNCTRIGSVVMVLPEIDSTNNLVKKYLLNGAEEGLVVIAESQKKGRGRLGRTWYSPSKVGIYLSVLLKPQFEPNHFSIFTILAGVAAVLTINEFSHQRASLKWPNDIVINKQKVSGLLCELVQNRIEPNGLIIGIGINVNHLPEQLPENLKNSATSLRIVNGLPVDRLTIIQSFLMNLDREYETYLTKGKRSMIEKWHHNTDLFGKKISINRGSTIFTGTAIKLNESGQLVLRQKNGHEEAFDSGEVTLHTS